MKKSFILALYLGFSLRGFSQSTVSIAPHSLLGARLGFNVSTERSYDKNEMPEYIFYTAGFQFAAIHERVFGPTFSLINEIHYSSQGVLWDNKKNTFKEEYTFKNIVIPIYFKWNIGSQNLRMHILLGPYASYISSGKVNADYGYVKGEVVFSGSDWETFKINRFGYGLGIGTGLSYRLSNNGIILFDARINHGLSIVHQYYYTYSKVLGFSIGYAHTLRGKSK